MIISQDIMSKMKLKCVYNRIIDIANFVNKYYKQKLKNINEMIDVYQNKLI